MKTILNCFKRIRRELHILFYVIFSNNSGGVRFFPKENFKC